MTGLLLASCGEKQPVEEQPVARLRMVSVEETALVMPENGTVPVLDEAPVSLTCRVTQILPLGSHDMFLAEVTGVTVDEAYMDENGKFDLSATKLIAYSHGEYFALGKKLGKFGYSVKKKK